MGLIAIINGITGLAALAAFGALPLWLFGIPGVPGDYADRWLLSAKTLLGYPIAWAVNYGVFGLLRRVDPSHRTTWAGLGCGIGVALLAVAVARLRRAAAPKR